MFKPFSGEDSADYYSGEESAPPPRPAQPVRTQAYEPTAQYSPQQQSYNSAPSYQAQQQQPRSESNMRQMNMTVSMPVVSRKPEQLEDKSGKGRDAVSIVNDLRNSCVVIINMEHNPKDRQRIIDFIAGAAYAIKGKVEHIARDIYVALPYKVDFKTDDLIEEIEKENRGDEYFPDM